MVAAGAALPLGGAYADEQEESHEKNVKLSELPAAVKDTILHASGGAQITKLESEMENGKPIYEAHFQPEKGAPFVVKVDQKGKLISKEAEKEREKNEK